MPNMDGIPSCRSVQWVSYVELATLTYLPFIQTQLLFPWTSMIKPAMGSWTFVMLLQSCHNLSSL